MRILAYCWELGSGNGHVAPFREIAIRMYQRGWRIVLIVKDLSRVSPFFQDLDITLLQAPIKNSPTAAPIREPATYGQILTNMGYQSAEGLSAQIAAWRCLFRTLSPSVLMFDHSPTACLAARELPIPTTTIGTGFCLPPSTQPLPQIAPWRPITREERLTHEALLVSTVNQALALRSIGSIESVADIFSQVNQHFLTTWPYLDHYASRDSAEYFGTWSTAPAVPASEIVARWERRRGPKVFAYLKPTKHLWKTVQAMGNFDGDSLLVTDRGHAGALRSFAQENVHVSDSLVNIKVVQKACDVAVLNGNHGSVAEFLLAGIPLVMLPVHFEQAVLANRVEALNAGVVASPEDPSMVIESIQRLVEDPVWAESAKGFQLDSESENCRIEAICQRVENLTCDQ